MRWPVRGRATASRVRGSASRRGSTSAGSGGGPVRPPPEDGQAASISTLAEAEPDWIATLRGFAFSLTGIMTLSTPLS